jgi:pilus assembly protein CpaB
MKNARAVAVLAISVVLGLVATAMAVSWVSQKGTVSANKVVVAATDIELGSRLAPQMLAMVDWPSGSMPQGAFKDVKELQDRVVKTSIQRGEAILTAKLAPVGTQGGLSAVITDGKRAMTVRVNDVVGVAGFALPGNYVDVMVNTQRDKDGTKPNQENQQISKTVLEHVLVLAVAQEAGRDDTKPKVVSAVTLELSPEDTEKLDLARNIGTLSLVLRNQVDKQPVTTVGITKKQLFGEKDQPFIKVADNKPIIKVAQSAKAAPRIKPVPVASNGNCVEVIHNNTRTLNCF